MKLITTTTTTTTRRGRWRGLFRLYREFHTKGLSYGLTRLGVKYIFCTRVRVRLRHEYEWLQVRVLWYFTRIQVQVGYFLIKFPFAVLCLFSPSLLLPSLYCTSLPLSQLSLSIIWKTVIIAFMYLWRSGIEVLSNDCLENCCAVYERGCFPLNDLR